MSPAEFLLYTYLPHQLSQTYENTPQYSFLCRQKKQQNDNTSFENAVAIENYKLPFISRNLSYTS